MKSYFNMRDEKWKTTVKWSLRLGLILGLIAGTVILLEKL